MMLIEVMVPVSKLSLLNLSLILSSHVFIELRCSVTDAKIVHKLLWFRHAQWWTASKRLNI